MCEAASSVRHRTQHLGNPPLNGIESGPEDELTTTSSIFEFLQQERRCGDGGLGGLGGGATTGGCGGEDDSELDIDSIFEEINRLSGDTSGLCVEDILREAEELISKQERGELEVPLLAVRKKPKTPSAAVQQPSRLPMWTKTVLNARVADSGGETSKEVNPEQKNEIRLDAEDSSSEEDGFRGAHFELTNKVMCYDTIITFRCCFIINVNLCI